MTPGGAGAGGRLSRSWRVGEGIEQRNQVLLVLGSRPNGAHADVERAVLGDEVTKQNRVREALAVRVSRRAGDWHHEGRGQQRGVWRARHPGRLRARCRVRPVGPVMVQFPAGALAEGVPMLLVSTPEEARLSLCMMVLLMMFTFNASCNDIPAPSQPAMLLTMMLLVMVTSCQRFGRVLKVDTSVPLTDWRRMPPPLPLSAELPWIRLALITKPGPVPSLNPGGQSASGMVPHIGSVSGVP